MNYALETFGDPWSLLIVRDIVRFKKRTYGEFLESDERISTNVLADRLRRLVQAGILRKVPDRVDRRRDIYKLTQKGVDIYPVMLEMIIWGVKYGTDIDEYYRSILPLLRKDKEGYVRERMKEIAEFAGSD